MWDSYFRSRQVGRPLANKQGMPGVRRRAASSRPLTLRSARTSARKGSGGGSPAGTIRPSLMPRFPGDGQFGEQSAREASVQVRPGAERHGVLDGVDSDEDELLRDQHELSVLSGLRSDAL